MADLLYRQRAGHCDRWPGDMLLKIAHVLAGRILTSGS